MKYCYFPMRYSVTGLLQIKCQFSNCILRLLLFSPLFPISLMFVLIYIYMYVYMHARGLLAVFEP